MANEMKDLAIKKLYYSISEVSKMTSIKPYVLRYWESEFPQLKPSKNRAGKRIYRRQDVQLVLLIKKLLYMDKFTIEGARQRIRALDGEVNTEIVGDDKRQAIIDEIRQGLQGILSLLTPRQ